MDDAKKLFCSISTDGIDDDLLEDILTYLDRHSFFVEKTAKTLVNKKNLNPKALKEMFKKGAFTEVRVKRKESFKDYLENLFTLDKLDEEEVRVLKQLSVLPSVEIEFTLLEKILDKEEDGEFEEILNYLVKKGWLIQLDDTYKLHQIIKEYIFDSHLPEFKEIERIYNYFFELIANSADPQSAIDNRDNFIFLDAFCHCIEKIDEESEKVSDFLERLGNIYHHLATYKKAEPLLLKSLKIRESILGKENLDTANAYNNLAVVYMSIKAYSKAEKYHLQALNIRELILGDQDSETATSYNNLGEFYISIKKYKEAELFILKALKICRKILKEEDFLTITSYNNLATLYRLTGRFNDAEKLSLKVVKVMEKTLGEQYPHRASAYNNLSISYYLSENFEDSYIYMQKAVTIWEIVFPEGHPHLIASRDSLKTLESRVYDTKVRKR